MKKLFIVDDEIEITQILKGHFESKGFEVSISASGEEIERLLTTQGQPDLVLLDYILAGPMTGLDVIKKLREFNSNAKVIFLTGALEDSVKEQAMALGVETFLIKPLLMRTLDEVVAQNLGGKTDA